MRLTAHDLKGVAAGEVAAAAGSGREEIHDVML
jgi:hypothetical protein